MSTVSSESPKVQYSVQRELSDGSLNRISVRVPYFSKDDIHVYVDDVEINSSAAEQSTYTWRWDGDYIAITPNVASGSEVLVRRITPINEAIHIFDGRSEFDDQSMDENFQQLMYIAQEYSEGSGIKDVFSDINMHGYKITNVGWATDDDDIVTYGQYKKDAEGAKVAMQKAEAAATKATAQTAEATKQAGIATTKASEASASASTATAKANTATQQATLATTKASEAEDSATSASQSATEADASAKNSANSASTATQQATLATQKATEAKTNADKAALSKDAAKVSETNAKKSEANAKESELKAKQYADQTTAGQLQADWKQTDSTKNDFIKNKPTLGTLSAKNSLAYSELTGVPTSFTPSSHTHPISQVTNLQAALDAKTNDATLQVDLTKIRQSITEVSSKVDGIGDTLSPTYAKKQTILDACDQAMNGANPVHAGDPTLDDIKLALATIQAQLGQLESRRYVKEAGKSSDGTSWYRVWSDGWIEQGGTYTSEDDNGYPVTLRKKMTTTNYHSTVTGGYDRASGNGFGYCYDKTTSGFKAVVIEPRGTWYVCGY